MIKNYIKTAWRNLWKNKVFSLINIGIVAWDGRFSNHKFPGYQSSYGQPGEELAVGIGNQ